MREISSRTGTDIRFLDVRYFFMPETNVIYNDNRACIEWSKRTTTKALQHIQMRENGIRENIASHFVSIHHIDGKKTLQIFSPKR
jgi:hypothetical protein